MIRVADYIMEQVYNVGAEHIFMVTGRGALFLSDAVAAHKMLTGISMHDEQAAAYSAVAYAQYTGQPGACLVSTGCAGTNALTGVLNSWQDGIPCIFISGQNKLKETSRSLGKNFAFLREKSILKSVNSSCTKEYLFLSLNISNNFNSNLLF